MPLPAAACLGAQDAGALLRRPAAQLGVPTGPPSFRLCREPALATLPNFAAPALRPPSPASFASQSCIISPVLLLLLPPPVRCCAAVELWSPAALYRRPCRLEGCCCCRCAIAAARPLPPPSSSPRCDCPRHARSPPRLRSSCCHSLRAREPPAPSALALAPALAHEAKARSPATHQPRLRSNLHSQCNQELAVHVSLSLIVARLPPHCPPRPLLRVSHFGRPPARCSSCVAAANPAARRHPRSKDTGEEKHGRGQC